MANSDIGYIFEGLATEDVGLFHGYLVYFVSIWYILRLFGIFLAIWYILWPFGIHTYFVAIW
jgi:hypothetical protein